MACANTISYISMQTYGWKSDGYIDKNKMNHISETLNIINKFKIRDLRSFFGIDKKIFEYLIHFVLNSEIEFKETSNSTLNIKKILYLTSLLLEVEQKKKYISYLYGNGGIMKIEEGVLKIEELFENTIIEYFKSTESFKRKIYNEELEEVYKSFEEVRGYSPFILEEYIYEYNEKFLETRTIISLIEKEALVEDIYRKTSRDRVVIRLMLDDLVLKECSKTNFIKSSFSDNNRLFRNPLIEISDYYILPFYIFVESAGYFRQRILKNHLNKGLDKKTKRLVERNYDEYDLNSLKSLFLKKDIVGDVNFDLNKFKECKELFKANPSIAQEIDFFIIENNTLHLMELKNRDIDRSLYGISQSVSKTKGYMIKMNERRLFFLKHKATFSRILGERFDSVELYLVNKNPNYLDNTFNLEYRVNIFLFEDFFKYIYNKI